MAADWATLWASLGKSPWVLPAAQSPTRSIVRLDQGALAQLIYQAMFTGDISPIPVVVHTLGAATNKAAALISVISAYQGLGHALEGSGGANQMMPYAINCDEAWSSWQPAALSDQRDSFDYQSDLEVARVHRAGQPRPPERRLPGRGRRPALRPDPAMSGSARGQQVRSHCGGGAGCWR